MYLFLFIYFYIRMYFLIDGNKNWFNDIYGIECDIDFYW